MDRHVLIALSIAACVVGCASAAKADGPVIVTQSTALAGGVTPGDTPGFPVTISEPGTYQLGSAIQLTSGIGFEVTAGNVTLDLAGQEIDGHGGATVGVRGKGIRLVIKNGNIQRFKNNAVLSLGAAGATGKSNWTIDHVAIFDNGRAGVVCGRDCQILNSTVTGNGFINIATAGVFPGVLMETGVVIGSTISNNSSYGIEATECAASGHNFLLGNNQGSGQQTNFNVFDLTPNFAAGSCPSPARSAPPTP